MNSIPISDFPACILGEPPELTADSFVIGATATYSWRNIFSCINLLRVLNKLTKWKHSRIMMLVVFKSAPILKQTLKVRHAMMQLYVLKLLKMQTRYLGRQWRKSNMKTISAIYSKVRHRLNDDWAFGNGEYEQTFGLELRLQSLLCFLNCSKSLSLSEVYLKIDHLRHCLAESSIIV